MASRPDTARHQHTDTMLTAALLLSLAMHAAVLGLLPGISQEAQKPVEQLTVELQPPPPKPLPPPEPPKPEPEKPKPEPKKLPPPPKPLPVIQPKTELPPPRAVETPPPPPVIAAAPKANEPLPTVTAPPPPAEPLPPPKPINAPPDLDAARNNYGSMLSREFAKHKQYPRIAQMRGWQGVARVELQIDASGNVTSSSIAESSGFEVLDKQALEMVRKASPLPLPPEALRGRDFTIVVPVSFKLE